MACTQEHTCFQPATQWTQDPDNHILRVCLPGFRKDEFKVQVDNSGKLTIRGRRPLGDGKYMRLEQVFDVPKDSHIDKIRGKFEDASLFLFMPKKVATERGAPDRAVSCEKERGKEAPRPPKKEAECIPEEPAAVHEEMPLTEKKGAEHPVQEEHIPEQKPRSSQVSDDKFEEYKKKAMAFKVRIEEEVEGWLDCGLMDGLLETISKNKKTIAIAAAAFSAGFYISRKLRSSGR